MPNKVDTYKSPITTLIERAEELGWYCNQDEQGGKCYIEFFQGSPAGEDFGFTAWGDTVEEIVRDIREYAEDFDAEEHVKELLDAKANGFAGVPDVFTLVEDAKAIQEMLNTLAWDDTLRSNEREEFTLRKKIEDTKAEYMERYGELGWQYTDEGLPYAIQDYHGSVGSVMDFTADDWLACKENGWTLDEVCRLCDEERFGSGVSTLSEFFNTFLGDLLKEDAICAVNDFYTWHNELLPAAMKVYAD